MPEPSPDALIAPWISQIADLVKAGSLTPEEMAKPYLFSWQRLPSELLPFVQSLNLSTVAQVLKANPMLYWHPLMSRQILYLRRLQHDEAEWHRLGWERQWDSNGDDWPPAEVAYVDEHLQKLVEAHVSGLFPGKRIVWQAQPKQRGPKSGFDNPHPAHSGAEWVDTEQLARDFCRLHALFKAKLTAARGVRRMGAEAQRWYQDLPKRWSRKQTSGGLV